MSGVTASNTGREGLGRPSEVDESDTRRRRTTDGRTDILECASALVSLSSMACGDKRKSKNISHDSCSVAGAPPAKRKRCPRRVDENATVASCLRYSFRRSQMKSADAILEHGGRGAYSIATMMIWYNLACGCENVPKGVRDPVLATIMGLFNTIRVAFENGGGVSHTDAGFRDELRNTIDNALRDVPEDEDRECLLEELLNRMAPRGV